MNSNQQRARATAKTAMGNLNDKVDTHTKRMAGLALAGLLAPGVVDMVDDKNSNFAEDFVGGTIAAGGLGVGGYLGYRQATIPEAEMDNFIANRVAELKKEAQVISKTQGPQAGVEYFAREKANMLDDLGPIDPKRAVAFNNNLRSAGDFGGMAADLDLPNKSPRQLRGMSRGAALGALASALPAYLMLSRRDNE